MNINKKLEKYLKENLENDKRVFKKFRSFRVKEEVCDEECIEENYRNAYMGASACASVDTFLNTELNENKFQKLLFNYIDSKGLKDSDVYNKAGIDRRLFSKIRSDENYHPSKETVISLASSLELSIDELEKLLDSASYSLPKNNKFDLIIRFCFLEKIYNIMDINDLLDRHECNLL